MGKMKQLDIKIKEFFEVARELADLTKCLSDLGLFPFMANRIEGRILDKIEKLENKLPKFTKLEISLISRTKEHKAMDLGICFCGGHIRKLRNESYCIKCNKLFYEE